MDESTLGQKIRERLAELGWNQGQLAERINVSQPIISSYIRDLKTPSQGTLRLIGSALDLPIEYLLGEASRRGPVMTTPSGELSWHERKAPEDGTRSYGNARAELFRCDYDTLAREPGQNSNDASLGDEVSMEYRLGVLSDVRLQQFLKAVQWEVLRPHYETVAEDISHRTSRRYARALRQLEEKKELWLLRIDDYATSGLTGGEFDSGCFSALTRFSQDSQKKGREGTSGGRFGLGSASLSAASGFDLLFFFSNLSKPMDGKTDGRLIGRAVFPYHSVESREFEGPFFWGQPHPDQLGAKRLSAWSNPQLQDSLWLTRDPQTTSARTGTSILIVGFEDPNGEDLDARNAEEAITQLASSFENWFWPAIARGRLSARFTRYDNDRKVSERVLDVTNITHPYAPLLTDEPEVAKRLVTLHVPKSKNDDAAVDHSAKLLVQTLSDDQSANGGQVATMRGPLMVVKYRLMPALALGARPFRAALLVGEASPDFGQPVSAADEAAEAFLAKAEPPQHNDWTSRGTDLTSEYRGGGAQLEKFWEAVRAALREIVSQPNSDDTLGPEALRRLLSVPGGDRPPGKKAEIVKLEWRDSNFEVLAATVRLSFRKDRDQVALQPQLFVKTDAGVGVELPCAIEAETGCVRVGDRSFVFSGAARDATVLIEPDWVTVPVRPDLSAIRVDVSVMDRREV